MPTGCVYPVLTDGQRFIGPHGRRDRYIAAQIDGNAYMLIHLKTGSRWDQKTVSSEDFLEYATSRGFRPFTPQRVHGR